MALQPILMPCISFIFTLDLLSPFPIISHFQTSSLFLLFLSILLQGLVHLLFDTAKIILILSTHHHHQNTQIHKNMNRISTYNITPIIFKTYWICCMGRKTAKRINVGLRTSNMSLAFVFFSTYNCLLAF